MKTIIITGASDGLGKALATKCLEQDMRVINISLSPCKIDGGGRLRKGALLI